jgi:16S rRNA (cytidine1402-2'-O)-methyltransferase
LTFVPTPLGNLRDITLRALDVLRDCDVIVAEDTRVARRLLSALDLPSKPIWSYREQNAAEATESILERARTEHVAVVTDAGMPGISDPGRELVAAARGAGIAIDVLPGPCAFVCAGVLSGYDIRRLTFAGFVPRALGERERALSAALASGTTTAYYESPNRLVATLEHLHAFAPHAPVFVAREMTKRFEQQIAGTPSDVLAALERPVRGEIVLVLGPVLAAPAIAASANDIDGAIDELLAAGASPAQAAKKLAAQDLGDRTTIYRRIVERKAGRPNAS